MIRKSRLNPSATAGMVVTRGMRSTLWTAPPTSGWTALGSTTVSSAYGSRSFSQASATGDSWHGETRTLSPTSNYTAEFYIENVQQGGYYGEFGVLLSDSSGKMIAFFIENSAGSTYEIVVANWNSATSFNASVYTATLLPSYMPNWLRFRDDNTNVYADYSYNSVDWANVWSASRTAFLTSAATKIGWGCNPNNASGAYTMNLRLRHLSGVT